MPWEMIKRPRALERHSKRACTLSLVLSREERASGIARTPPSVRSTATREGEQVPLLETALLVGCTHDQYGGRVRTKYKMVNIY